MAADIPLVDSAAQPGPTLEPASQCSLCSEYGGDKIVCRTCGDPCACGLCKDAIRNRRFGEFERWTIGEHLDEFREFLHTDVCEAHYIQRRSEHPLFIQCPHCTKWIVPTPRECRKCEFSGYSCCTPSDTGLGAWKMLTGKDEELKLLRSLGVERTNAESVYVCSAHVKIGKGIFSGPRLEWVE